MTEFLTMSELIDAANAAFHNLEVADGRVAAELTERTVRYYVTLGLVRSPVRQGGRSLWTRDHVNDLIRIRRAQALGRSLKQIPSFRPASVLETWATANLHREARDEAQAMSFSSLVSPVDTTPDMRFGWSVRVSRDITLSGFDGTPPTADQLEAVRAVLLARLDD